MLVLVCLVRYSDYCILSLAQHTTTTTSAHQQKTIFKKPIEKIAVIHHITLIFFTLKTVCSNLLARIIQFLVQIKK